MTLDALKPGVEAWHRLVAHRQVGSRDNCVSSSYRLRSRRCLVVDGGRI